MGRKGRGDKRKRKVDRSGGRRKKRMGGRRGDKEEGRGEKGEKTKKRRKEKKLVNGSKGRGRMGK